MIDELVSRQGLGEEITAVASRLNVVKRERLVDDRFMHSIDGRSDMLHCIRDSASVSDLNHCRIVTKSDEGSRFSDKAELSGEIRVVDRFLDHRSKRQQFGFADTVRNSTLFL